jgi:Carboxypeptidase regulatory-like domain
MRLRVDWAIVPRTIWCVACLILLLPASSSGQIGSAISGTVRDSSGGVLPGVTVEAASPVLIEGSRSTVTDANGQYQITDLRPGDYAVTFTLAGFRSVRREAIRLTAAFTATINVDLQVGAIEESVTVTGESPLVDVRNSVSQSVMDRQALDTVPSGRDPFSVGQLIPGVTTNTPDVGGTQIMQQPTLQVHGSASQDDVFMVDNVQIQHMGFGGNQTGFYFNDGLMEEISYQTSSLPAEAPVGGVQINMIPRDGGNQFRGTAFATGANGGMQSNNADEDLVALGFTARNRVKSVYDVNLTYGGPIQRERLWFFGTYRVWSANNYLANTFDSQGNQAVDDQRIQDGTLRLTWQAARKHKIAAHYDRSAKWRGHRPNNWINASINEPVSSVEQITRLNYIGELKWSSPITNRLLSEFAVFTMPVNYSLKFQQEATPDAIATFDQIRSVVTGVSPRQDINQARMFTYAGYIAYVTGAHNFKTGMQVRTGWSEELFETRGDIVQIVSNGVPQSVRLVNTPSGHRESGTNLGVYVQDSWTLGRVTINPGVRFERFEMSIPAQSAGAGRWVPARQFAEQKNIVNWNTVSPRFGFAWDVTGDGRTAIKGGVSRYDRLAGVNLVQPLNLKNIAFQLCPWNDPNGDRRAQETEIDFARCTGSLQPSLGFVDPDLKRPYQWEFNVMVQRQIGSRTAVMAGYYGRRFWDLYTTVNDAVPPEAYTPVTITNPLTNAPLTVFNQNPATRGLVRNVLKTIPDLRHRYHGVEFQVNTRLTRATFFAGLTIGANRGDQDTGDLNNPNLRINNYGAVGFDAPYQIRGGFSYTMPAGIQLSGSIREQSGLPEMRTFPVTTTQVPGLTQVTQNVQVTPRGEYRFPWVNIVDLRVTRTFRSGATRFEPIIDIFNIFNDNAVTNAVQTVGSSLGRPSAIVMGRLVRLGARMTF